MLLTGPVVWAVVASLAHTPNSTTRQQTISHFFTHLSVEQFKSLTLSGI